MAEDLKVVVDAKAELGEGPSWNAQDKLIYWVDIMGRKMHIYDPELNTNRTIDVGQYIGAVVPAQKDTVILALQNGLYRLNLVTEAMDFIADPESDLNDNRFNDGKCDPAGRFWAGTMSLKGEQETGSLYFLDTDGKLNKVLEKVSISNGLCWSPDQKTMYFTDSPTKQIAAFDYDKMSGKIENKRIVVDLTAEKGVPDGMTIDEEGMLWVAHWGGHRVSRFNPENGRLLEVIPVPAENVTSCVFGGKNLDQLYITTARIGMSDEALANYPLSGGLFSVKTKVKGLPTFTFGG
jgi:sugar lactone lactonase YvrE